MTPDPELEESEESALEGVDDDDLVEMTLEDIESVQAQARRNLRSGTTQPRIVINPRETVDEFIDRTSAQFHSHQTSNVEPVLTEEDLEDVDPELLDEVEEVEETIAQPVSKSRGFTIKIGGQIRE